MVPITSCHLRSTHYMPGPLHYFIESSLNPMRLGRYSSHLPILAYVVRYLFKCHPFFPARIPEGSAHRTSISLCCTLPAPASGTPAACVAETQCSIFRSNRDTSRQNLSVAHPETTRGDEHRRCSLCDQLPRPGKKKLQAVFQRRKFPFINVWQPLWQSSRNTSIQNHCRLRKHPPLTFPKRKAAAPGPHFSLEPISLSYMHASPTRMWQRCPLIICIPHTEVKWFVKMY